MVEALRVLEKDQYWVPLLAEGGRCVWCQDREKAEVEKVSAFVRKCLALLASHKWLPLELCVFIEDRLLCSDTVAQVSYSYLYFVSQDVQYRQCLMTSVARV